MLGTIPNRYYVPRSRYVYTGGTLTLNSRTSYVREYNTVLRDYKATFVSFGAV